MVRGPSASAQRAPRLGDRRGAFSRAPRWSTDRICFRRSFSLVRATRRTARAMIARYRDRNDRHVHPARAGGRAAFGARRESHCRSQAARTRWWNSAVGMWATTACAASECAPCLPFNLARAFDAAGKLDSAAVMFEAVSLHAILVEDRRRDGSGATACRPRTTRAAIRSRWGTRKKPSIALSCIHRAVEERGPGVAASRGRRAQASRAIDAGGEAANLGAMPS